MISIFGLNGKTFMVSRIFTGIMKFMGDYPMGTNQTEVDCALKILRVRVLQLGLSMFVSILTNHSVEYPFSVEQITVPISDVTFQLVTSGYSDKTKPVESSAQILCANLKSHDFRNKAAN